MTGLWNLPPDRAEAMQREVREQLRAEINEIRAAIADRVRPDDLANEVLIELLERRWKLHLILAAGVMP